METTGENEIYECGTLRYSKTKLIVVSALLMLGTFCMTYTTATVGIVTLRLKDLGASNMTIAFIVSTITGIFNMTVCPTVSFKSDRYRGKRWGRRIVFIIGTLPMMCLSLIGFALSGPLGNIIAKWLAPIGGFSSATVTIVIIGIVMAVYKFFYMFIGSVIYYLYRDVIPAQFVARVIGMTRVASTAGGTIFNFFCFKYAQSHFSSLQLIAAAVYGIGVGLMCLLIKEPQLPPLTETEKKQSKGFSGVMTFMKESFSHRYYWFSTLAGSFRAAGSGIGVFTLFFVLNMGLNLGQAGEIGGYAGVASLVIGMTLATAGTILVDRWNPVRMNFYAIVIHTIFALVFCKWIFFSPGAQIFFFIYLGIRLLEMLPLNLIGISSMPRLIRTLPQSRFGQFCSASAMVRSLTTLACGLILGGTIDFCKAYFNLGDFVYRLIWIWQIFFFGIGLIFFMLTYREYLKLGGERNYRAPAPWSPEKWETLSASSETVTGRKIFKIGIYSWDFLLLLYLLATAAGALYTNDQKFWLCGVPVLAVCCILWFLLRATISRRMPKETTPVAGLIHPGILIIAAVIQLQLFALGAIQTVMLINNSNPRTAYMWAFELIILLVMLGLLLICSRIEKTEPQTDI